MVVETYCSCQVSRLHQDSPRILGYVLVVSGCGDCPSHSPFTQELKKYYTLWLESEQAS